MTITFDSPKRIPDIYSGADTPLSSITINQIVDLYEYKQVIAYCKEYKRILLWGGDDYDAIGQWTDADVVNRINQLYP